MKVFIISIYALAVCNRLINLATANEVEQKEWFLRGELPSNGLPLNEDSSLTSSDLKEDRLGTLVEDLSIGGCVTEISYNTIDCTGKGKSISYPEHVKGEMCDCFGKRCSIYISDFCTADGFVQMDYDNKLCEGKGYLFDNRPNGGCVENGEGGSYSQACSLEPCNKVVAFLSLANSGFYLNIDIGAKRNGGKIHQWKYPQKWTVQKRAEDSDGNDIVAIQSQESKLYLNIDIGAKRNGGKIHQWDYPQRWTLKKIDQDSDGNDIVTVQSQESKLYLNVDIGAKRNGGKIHQWNYPQQWKMIK